MQIPFSVSFKLEDTDPLYTGLIRELQQSRKFSPFILQVLRIYYDNTELRARIDSAIAGEDDDETFNEYLAKVEETVAKNNMILNTINGVAQNVCNTLNIHSEQDSATVDTDDGVKQLVGESAVVCEVLNQVKDKGVNSLFDLPSTEKIDNEEEVAKDVKNEPSGNSDLEQSVSEMSKMMQVLLDAFKDVTNTMSSIQQDNKSLHEELSSLGKRGAISMSEHNVTEKARITEGVGVTTPIVGNVESKPVPSNDVETENSVTPNQISEVPSQLENDSKPKTTPRVKIKIGSSNVESANNTSDAINREQEAAVSNTAEQDDVQDSDKKVSNSFSALAGSFNY